MNKNMEKYIPLLIIIGVRLITFSYAIRILRSSGMPFLCWQREGMLPRIIFCGMSLKAWALT